MSEQSTRLASIDSASGYVGAFWRELAVGTVLAASTIGFLLVLPREFALDVLAVLLTSIASVYIGFAARDGRPRKMILEFGIAAVFIAIALVGLWVWPYVWILGYLGHGLWDLVHHPRGIQTAVAEWYLPLCTVYDVLIAVFLITWL